MNTDFMFAYGASMNYSDLRAWLESNGYDSSLVMGRWAARLDGYDFVWNFYSPRMGGGSANIEPKEGAVIWGVLIEYDLSLLKAFDRKEGYPVYYSKERKMVTRQADKEIIEAWVYVAAANKGARTDIGPTRQYRSICEKGALEIGLPEEHVEKIRQWPTVK